MIDVSRARYTPERLIDSFFGDLGQNADQGHTIFEIKNFGTNIVTLKALAAVSDANAKIRLVVDEEFNDQDDIHSDALGDVENTVAVDIPIRRSLEVRVVASAALTDWGARIHVETRRPTIAQKIALGLPLTNEDINRISRLKSRGLDIPQEVKLGVLPSVFNEINKLTRVGNTKIFGDSRTLDTDQDTELYKLSPKPDNVLILEGIAVIPEKTGRISIDRDGDKDIIRELNPSAMPDFDEDKFAPLHLFATDTLTVRGFTTSGTIANFNSRIRVSEVSISLMRKAMAHAFGNELIEVTESEIQELNNLMLIEKALGGAIKI